MQKEKLPIGTIYQAKSGGNYYLRYQIQGKRKNVNLKTDDYDKALKVEQYATKPPYFSAICYAKGNDANFSPDGGGEWISCLK